MLVVPEQDIAEARWGLKGLQEAGFELVEQPVNASSVARKACGRFPR